MAKTVTIPIPSFKKAPKKLIVALVLIVAVILGYRWYDVYTAIAFRDAGQREAARIAYSISSKVDLPQGEDPALATVADKSKINRGGVLAGAENGDKVLLYYQSGRAVLYRPSAGKVVAIGPIVLDASASQVKDTRVVVRDGGGDASKASAALGLLKQRYRTAKIADVEKANRSDYPSTIVVDLSENGKKNEFAGAIIELLGARRGVLPQSEPKPDADILIIIGQDYRN